MNLLIKLCSISTLLIGLAFGITPVSAAELGRLFYTPLQRAQLESQQTIDGSSVEGTKRNVIIVNGVIQKQGGNRIVWINGTQQPAENGNENSPASVTVNVPGKSHPVQVKVGQRLLIEPSLQEEPK